MGNYRLMRAFSFFLALMLTTLIGCGKPSEVTGTVTVNGTPLEKGQITFQPMAAGGRPEGAEIVQGKYKAKGIPQGKYKASVVSTNAKVGDPNMGMDEAIKAAGKGAPPNPIPPGTAGNNIEVDITGSDQNFDMKLIPPQKK